MVGLHYERGGHPDAVSFTIPTRDLPACVSPDGRTRYSKSQKIRKNFSKKKKQINTTTNIATFKPKKLPFWSSEIRVFLSHTPHFLFYQLIRSTGYVLHVKMCLHGLKK